MPVITTSAASTARVKARGRARARPRGRRSCALRSRRRRAAIYDLSGNLKEWTADLLGTTVTPPRSVYGVRGGAYDSPRDGLRCDLTFAPAPEDFSYANLGFRCCGDTAP